MLFIGNRQSDYLARITCILLRHFYLSLSVQIKKLYAPDRSSESCLLLARWRSRFVAAGLEQGLHCAAVRLFFMIQFKESILIADCSVVLAAHDVGIDNGRLSERIVVLTLIFAQPSVKIEVSTLAEISRRLILGTQDHCTRPVDILVLSDIHLGTYGCHAKQLLNYLRSITPKQVILNGDIIDIWQFSKRYWPKSHMKVVSHLVKWVSHGVPVAYVTGNHDEILRKFAGFHLGSFEILNKMVLHIDHQKAWVFHGDVFDITMQYSKWLAKLGSKGYDLLILINRFVNFLSDLFGRGRVSLSKKVKNGVKAAVNYVSNFEETAIQIAARKKFSYVICGHIHQPMIRHYETDRGTVTYMNSGDWIENLSALEYSDGKWSIYQYNEDEFSPKQNPDGESDSDLSDKTAKELYSQMLAEIMK